jgi:uncharacterized cupin superfamily protein
MFFKVVASATDGRLSVIERTLPPGGLMPPPHAHLACDEAHFVLDGVVTILVEGERLERETDCFVLVPGGVIHTFGNHSSQPARLLVLHSRGLDRYLQRAIRALVAARAARSRAERELLPRHGMELA